MKGAFANGQDYVFHCAAESRIGPAIENPVNAVDITSEVLVRYYNVQENLELRKYYIHRHHQVME